MISKRTKYGLKALSFLAKQDKGKPVLISTIASSENISQKFLESILLDLKKQGFLGSKKGKGGGYYLLKPGNQITIAEVFRVLEGPIAWLPCVSLNYYEKCDDCVSEETCQLNHMMIEVRDNILNVIENKTIDDL
ncbi:MAG: Rrf2 family transcriptional regulator [Crocinitomicaceae bacterium]|nr:Rrf2 family transcriptional regulator [Crocinitomicaceae bacterium]